VQAELEGLIENLTVYLTALKNYDAEGLSNALREGRLIRESIKRDND